MTHVGFGLTLASLVAVSALAQEGKPGPVPIGWGGLPITPMHATAWFGHRADAQEKTVTLMVFFEGAPQWHDQTKDFKAQFGKSPATIDMKVNGRAISIRYTPETGTVQVLDRRFELGSDNVFLVKGVDEASPRVEGLGLHDLTFRPDDAPPLVLLRRDASLLSSLLGEQVKERPDQGGAEVVALDRQGLDLLDNATSTDDARACDLFHQAATQGYAPAQYRLGICYGSGRGRGEDQAVANEWYRRAADQGHKDAQYKLAHSYRVGRGMDADLPAALRWYVKAAEQEDAQAQFNLGLMHALGQGTAADPAKAFSWYLKAAANGEAAAQHEVARRYRDGDGVGLDRSEAAAWAYVLQSHGRAMSPEDWKKVQEFTATIETVMSQEAIAEARARAQQRLRSCTKQYLRMLHDR